MSARNDQRSLEQLAHVSDIRNLAAEMALCADDQGRVPRSVLRALYERLHRGGDPALRRRRHGHDSRYGWSSSPTGGATSKGSKSSDRLRRDLLMLEVRGVVVREGDGVRVLDWPALTSLIQAAGTDQGGNQ